MSFATFLSGLVGSVMLGIEYGAREASLGAVATALLLALVIGRSR